MFFSLIVSDSTVVNGEYLPRTNDSFYHAHRILDAATGSRGFYQFDEHLQAPEGTWISWPWAYDYLMAKATQVALWIQPTLDPMAFLVYVPVAWIAINAALFLAAAGAIGLSREMRLLAMLCFALSPMTQLLHSVGMLDHHYVEDTFVLLGAWLGLRWFETPDDPRRAAALGVALGLAPAFHNGLFILQIVPLTAGFVLWLRGTSPARSALLAFGIALVGTTQLIVLPSAPYLNGMFEFGLLSWFHLYVAVCTAATLAFMGFRPFSRRNLGILGAVAMALAVPLGAQIVSGAGFLSGKFSILNEIAEAQSPLRLFTASWFGPVATAGYYSWLVVLTPVLLAVYGYRLLVERQAVRIYFAITVVFGVAMLLDQLRLHHFGFFGLVAGSLLLIDELRSRRHWHRGAVFVATFAAVVLAYQPSLHSRLFVVYAPGADPDYANALPIFHALHDLCAADPGVVLANSDDGNPIVFHSECSVIANNFILRPSDKAHIDELRRLMRLSPAEIRSARPDIKYLLVRRSDFTTRDGDSVRLDDSPIARQLLASEAAPEGYSLMKTIPLDTTGAAFAKLYKIAPMSVASHAPAP